MRKKMFCSVMVCILVLQLSGCAAKRDSPQSAFQKPSPSSTLPPISSASSSADTVAELEILSFPTAQAEPVLLYPIVDWDEVGAGKTPPMYYMDRTGKKILGPYEHAFEFSEGLAVVSDQDGDGYYYIDATGTPQFGITFSSAHPVCEQRVVVRAKDGEIWVIDLENQDAYHVPNAQRVENFADGMAVVLYNTDKEPIYGYINAMGEPVIPPQYRLAGRFSNGLAPVVDLDTDKLVYIDKTGKIIIDPGVEYFDPIAGVGSMVFSEGLAFCQKGYIDTTGKLIIAAQDNWSSGRPFSEGRASIRIDGKIAFIDREGNVIVQTECIGANDFSEGLAAVWRENQNPNVPYEWQYGFIDTTGKLVIGFDFYNFYAAAYAYVPQYTFNNGLASVSSGAYFRYIDQNGNLVS